MKLRTSSIVRNSPIGRTRKRCCPPVTSPALTEKFRPLERVAQARHVDAVGGDADRVDEDAELERLDALQRDARDAVEALERLLEVAVERVVLPREVLVAGDAHGEHAVVPGGEHLSQDAVRAGRKLVLDGLELGPYREADRRGVAVPLEQHDKLGAGLGGRGADLLDAGERRDRLLGWPRDQLLDLLGRRAGVGDRDLQPREADIREELERQERHRDNADQRDRDEGHQRRDGPAQRKPCVDHVRASRPPARSASAVFAAAGPSARLPAGWKRLRSSSE
jgi:hypothetical protein